MSKLQKMQTNMFTTLSECVDFIKKNKVFGVVCPCCTQIVKVYKRKLNTGMAIELITLYRLTKNKSVEEDKYFHQTKFARVTGGEISKLIHWGLVEQKPKSTEDAEKGKKTSGSWAITEIGKEFVQGKVTVLSHIYISNKKLIGFSSEKISIKESLGKKFEYDSLMDNLIEIF